MVIVILSQTNAFVMKGTSGKIALKRYVQETIVKMKRTGFVRMALASVNQGSLELTVLSLNVLVIVLGMVIVKMVLVFAVQDTQVRIVLREFALLTVQETVNVI